MALRVLTSYEVYELARNEKFLATVQAVILEKSQTRRSDVLGPVKLGAYPSRTITDKRDYIFSSQNIASGAVSNGQGFARLYAVQLQNDAVQIDMPPAGDSSWNAQDVTDELVDTGVLAVGNTQFEAVWTDWVEFMDINDQYYVEQQTFYGKVRTALMKASIDAIGEDTSNYNQTVVDKRHAYALQVINNPDAQTNSKKYSVSSNGALHEYSTYSDVLFTVNAQFNDYAGVTDQDLNPV